jgi:hypothetical protein
VNTGMPARAYPAAHTFPVSVKGVAVQDGKVLLLENERAQAGGPFHARTDPAAGHAGRL